MPSLQRRVIRGEPIRVMGKEYVPEATVISWGRRRATMRLDGHWAWGSAFVHIRPRALIERGPGGERRIPIRDTSLRMLAGLAAGAVFVFFLTSVAAELAGRRV